MREGFNLKRHEGCSSLVKWAYVGPSDAVGIRGPSKASRIMLMVLAFWTARCQFG